MSENKIAIIAKRMIPAPWIKGNEYVVGGDNIFIDIWDEENCNSICRVGAPNTESSEMHTTYNASAIVSAVNETYGKGINPEAVSDLLADLKALVSHFDKLDPATAASILINNAKITIAKSKII